MQGELLMFLRAVVGYWGSFLTGGVVIAIIWLLEHYRGQPVPWRVVAFVAVLAFAASTFMAWREEHRALINERKYRSRAADEFAGLRHTAQKRYYEWWEACHDPKKAPAAKDAAELIRTRIVEKLRSEISEAEADYFNTPRMFEPFPGDRNLITCPEAALINEFGYRVQRLSDVVQRILLPRGSQA